MLIFIKKSMRDTQSLLGALCIPCFQSPPPPKNRASPKEGLREKMQKTFFAPPCLGEALMRGTFVTHRFSWFRREPDWGMPVFYRPVFPVFPEGEDAGADIFYIPFNQ